MRFTPFAYKTIQSPIFFQKIFLDKRIFPTDPVFDGFVKI